MFEKPEELTMEWGSSIAESLADEMPLASEHLTNRMRAVLPDLLAAAIQTKGFPFDANEAPGAEARELAAQIMKGLTDTELSTIDAWKLHIRQCNLVDALENYRKAREELRNATRHIMRRCVRTLVNQFEHGAISPEPTENESETLSATG